jgi:hypothetical protein
VPSIPTSRAKLPASLMDRCPNVLAGRKVVPERANKASLLRCTVASAFEVGIDTVRERLALQRYLDSLEKADEEAQANIDQSAVQAALEKIKQNPEPEAGFMLVPPGDRASVLPAENATGNYVKVIQRLPVRIRLDPGQDGIDRVRPGMSVEPTVHY